MQMWKDYSDSYTEHGAQPEWNLDNLVSASIWTITHAIDALTME